MFSSSLMVLDINIKDSQHALRVIVVEEAMRVVIQKVKSSSVLVENEVVSSYVCK